MGATLLNRGNLPMNKKLFTTLIAATLAGQHSFALADNEPAMLEEVLVTATKREKNLQDISVAVSALSAQMLKDTQMTESADLVTLVPSLNMLQSESSGASSFNIRGIGTQVFGIGVEPSVSTMIDGIVLGRSGQAFMQLNDIQRVEVLRGPQGTLFGKNSSAGVIHFITQDPTEEHEGQITATAIEQDEYQLGGTLSGPISDTLGYRLTAFGSDKDGYTKNLYDGDYINNSQDWSVRGKLRWLPTDSLELKYTYDYSEQDCNCTARSIRDTSDPAAIAPLVASDENDKVNINGPTSNDVESYGHAMEVNWDLGEYTLTSITAYRDWQEDNQQDLDYGPTTLYNLDSASHTEQDQFTQELRLTSPSNRRLTYVAGLFYFQQDVDREQYRTILDNTSNAIFSTDATNYAAFGEATFSLLDTLRLVGGARYTYDELGYDFERTGDGFGLQPPLAPIDDEEDNDEVTVKAAIEWDFTDNAMTYLSYAQGYKGLAYNALFSASEESLNEAVDPELSDAYELGLKSNWLDGRLEINAALFFTQYEDFQASSLIQGVDENDISFSVQNVGEVETKGLEMDFRWLLTDNLLISGGFALIDATIEDYPFGTCSFGQEDRGECPLDYQDLSGEDLPQSPDWKYNIAANYTIPLTDIGLDVVTIANYRAQDDVQFDISQDPGTIQDSYGILDLSLKIADQKGRYDATLFVKNALDESYATSIYSMTSSLIPDGYVHFLPKTHERTAGITASYYF